LISQRIKVIVGNGGTNPWDAVFDRQLMRGTQTKFKHMAARTQLRPRDMIQFSNLCLQRAKATGSERIQNQDIAGARPQYSEYLISELHDEIHAVFAEWRKYLDALRRIHRMRFRREVFDGVFEELKLARFGKSADEALELLYGFSVVGFTKLGGAGYGGSAIAFRYRDPSVNFDPAAPYYNVHPGLKEALELVDAGEESAP